MDQVRLAVAKSFLESYSRLPKRTQKKVRELTDKVREDPRSSGLNYETINGRDPRLRSLRVDQQYRLMVVKPDKGDVLLCVWVDNHDEAYAWAERKVFEVNPLSGVLQVYSVEEGQAALAAAVEEPAAPESAPGLFEAYDDEQLLFAGVPLPLLVAVRGVTSEHEYELLAPHLPADAREMLDHLVLGFSFMDALEEASRPKDRAEAVDPEDFAAAIERPVSQGQFHLVEGEDELQEMLDKPLEQWRVFLHPSQRRIVEWHVNGPIRVLGGAGTGKTVVLMHRAKHLVENVFKKPEERILVTTFTRNLATDLASTLRSLIPRGWERIEVRNLHAWARTFYEQQVGRRVAVLDGAEARRELMARASQESSGEGLTVAFLLEEWDQVVQPQHVTSRAEYFKARRVGRGTRLGRQQRAEVWAIFERYRELLRTEGLLEWQDLVREARLCIESGKVRPPYVSVLADEVQDLSVPDLQLLRALVPPGTDDLFLVGDAHQRIYGHMASLGACGIEIRGRSRRLKLNYRTTEEIRNRAVGILEGLEVDDLDGGIDTLAGYRSLRTGPAPVVRHCASPEEEQGVVLETLGAWLDEGVAPEDICLAARTNALVDRYQTLLDQAGLDHARIQTEDPTSQPGIRLATMHRLKGLEFKRVLLCGVHEGTMPLSLSDASFGDEVSAEDHEQRERCLLYVAATRARDQLCVTGFGRPSALLSP